MVLLLLALCALLLLLLLLGFFLRTDGDLTLQWAKRRGRSPGEDPRGRSLTPVLASAGQCSHGASE